MSATKEQLRADTITFFSACREDTGRMLCDSGDYYGRAYDKPMAAPDNPAILLEICRDGTEVLASLRTEHYLDARYGIDRELQAKFEVWEAKHSDLSWFEAGSEFMEELGFEQLQRGNTYNGEQDLTQSIVFEVWKPEGQKKDGDGGIYAVEGIRIAIYVHTGCDERSGHSRPLFCIPKSDYAIPTDCVVGYSFFNGRKGKRKLTQQECQRFDERYQVGYSGNPSYQLSKDLEKAWGLKGDRFRARLKTGETFDVCAYFNEE